MPTLPDRAQARELTSSKHQHHAAMQFVAVRLTVDEVAALDAIAGRDSVSRSEAIRRELAHVAA
ncbi:ribbon-helix-helix protein, CopG family [Propioniciclava tarda]|uniref:Ribbon-helix-helix protein, CopG family n=1 Tax=Propioniciclava tarda TaxID=433330 RepID=A0A4Q9KPG5_PROTD|nr:ribbon-helix-helix protein, CopG family [Propioniciclava tarda]